ncbi:MAG TPA: ribonuclease P protein component [Spirochaetota bacterium]|nr:ribonuclease P protein component [Spirochaetota bacterium]
MKKIYSLKGKGNYQEVFEKGKRFNIEGIQLIVLRLKFNEASSTRDGGPEGGGRMIRIGISIGARYGGACERNTAKRRIRAICGEMLPSIEQGYYLVLRPTGAFGGLEYSRAKDSIRRLFLMSGVLKR